MIKGFAKGLFLVLSLSLACASQQPVPAPARPWPQHNGRAHILESEVVELKLRLLALELQQESRGQWRYYFSFFSRLGKIEAVCVYQAPFKNLDQDAWEKAVAREIHLLSAGVTDALADLSLAEGFDVAHHLEIRFHLEEAEQEMREVAVYRQGSVNWLVLPRSHGQF